MPKFLVKPAFDAFYKPMLVEAEDADAAEEYVQKHPELAEEIIESRQVAWNSFGETIDLSDNPDVLQTDPEVKLSGYINIGKC